VVQEANNMEANVTCNPVRVGVCYLV